MVHKENDAMASKERDALQRHIWWSCCCRENERRKENDAIQRLFVLDCWCRKNERRKKSDTPHLIWRECCCREHERRELCFKTYMWDVVFMGEDGFWEGGKNPWLESDWVPSAKKMWPYRRLREIMVECGRTKDHVLALQKVLELEEDTKKLDTGVGPMKFSKLKKALMEKIGINSTNDIEEEMRSWILKNLSDLR